MPPGQCASVPGRSVQPQTPTVGGAGHIDIELGARGRGDRHAAGAAQHLGRGAHAGSRAPHRVAMRSSASGCSLEMTRMRAPALRIAGVSGRMHQAFDGAIDHKAGLPQRRHHRRQLADRLAGARSSAPAPDGGLRGRRHDDMERSRAQPQQRQLGKVHVELARLRLRQDRRAYRPCLTAQRSNTSQNASIHLPSMRSANITALIASALAP